MTPTEISEILYAAALRLGNSRDKKGHFIRLPQIISVLAAEIAAERYSPGAFRVFIVKDPKVREIFAPAFRDRLAQQWLISMIEPYINPTFIDDAYSNRIGKGTHAALRRLQHFMHKPATRYYCQIDIRSFFPSIDRSILLSLWKKRLLKLPYDPQTLAQIDHVASSIITHSPLSPPPLISGRRDLHSQIPPHKSLFHTPEGKGLPIGSLSSQFFSNLYLDELDRYAKHTLKIKTYIRYVDDIVFLGDDAGELYRIKCVIDTFLRHRLSLSLHPEKTVIQRVSQGINFLGAIVFPHHRYVRRRNIRSFHQRVDFFNAILYDGVVRNPPNGGSWGALAADRSWREIPVAYLKPRILSTLNSYFGLFRHSNSFHLRKRLSETMGRIGGEVLLADPSWNRFCCFKERG